jgi:hypothetical protein
VKELPRHFINNFTGRVKKIAGAERRAPEYFASLMREPTLTTLSWSRNCESAGTLSPERAGVYMHRLRDVPVVQLVFPARALVGELLCGGS